MLPGGSDGNGHLPRPRRPRRAGLAAGGSPGQASQPHPAALPCTDYDVAYFKAYSHIGVHEEMLKDHVRTSTYRNAIMHHRDLISGKVVLDVGCGTGVLSIFCAFAGAARVYAVDASDIALQKLSMLLGHSCKNGTRDGMILGSLGVNIAKRKPRQQGFLGGD